MLKLGGGEGIHFIGLCATSHTLSQCYAGTCHVQFSKSLVPCDPTGYRTLAYQVKREDSANKLWVSQARATTKTPFFVKEGNGKRPNKIHFPRKH